MSMRSTSSLRCIARLGKKKRAYGTIGGHSRIWGRGIDAYGAGRGRIGKRAHAASFGPPPKPRDRNSAVAMGWAGGSSGGCFVTAPADDGNESGLKGAWLLGVNHGPAFRPTKHPDPTERVSWRKNDPE